MRCRDPRKKKTIIVNSQKQDVLYTVVLIHGADAWEDARSECFGGSNSSSTHWKSQHPSNMDAYIGLLGSILGAFQCQKQNLFLEKMGLQCVFYS